METNFKADDRVRLIVESIRGISGEIQREWDMYFFLRKFEKVRKAKKKKTPSAA